MARRRAPLPPRPVSDAALLVRLTAHRCLRCDRPAPPKATICEVCARAGNAVRRNVQPGPCDPAGPWWTDPRWEWDRAQVLAAIKAEETLDGPAVLVE